MIAKYRHRLPQLGAGLFLTDGGIETTLLYREGLELPHFAAFHLLRHAAGRAALRRYFRSHAAIARERGVGFVLESATWRASPDWGARLGYSEARLANANRDVIALLHELRAEFETSASPMPISGCIGPRGDAYRIEARMTPEHAAGYHGFQARVFAVAGVDFISAMTLAYAEEAIGIVQAARAVGLPVVISFTTETDGRLPSGQTLASAIAQVDAATGHRPLYYMINCAHPAHFAPAMQPGASWTQRIRGIRANASVRSHAELDACTELDAGDPADLALRCAELRALFPSVNVFGGCCGTDERHVGAICEACVAAGVSRPRCAPALAAPAAQPAWA